MGLDINIFRTEKGGDPEKVRESVKKRFQDPKIVDLILEKDAEWRKKRFQADQLRKLYNATNKEVGDRKKKDKTDPCTEQVAKAKELDLEIEQVKKEEAPILKELEKLVNKVGNLVHESVPLSNDEDENRVEKTWGQIPDIKVTTPATLGSCHHHELLAMIDGYEPKRGRKVAGHRGYYLKGYGAMLNMALIQYGLSFLFKRNYTPIQPPFFMRKNVMAETAQLSDFDDQLYKVVGNKDDEDLYLIATSEQPISAMYKDEWLETKDLPIRYAGFSSCFRKEAGAHGKDTWGIFRIHQFEKIEQFCITTPENSWAEHEEMIKVAEEFYQSLKLPYRVINIVSGALNDAAAKKYDLEAWFPGYEAYRELVSCSNCTDFQSRAMDIKIRTANKKESDKENKFVHMLNGTLCATERTLCCILENYQTKEGIRVPEVLIPYVGTDFIKYTKPIPKPTDLATEEDLKPKVVIKEVIEESKEEIKEDI